jgi:hypothetical protein
MNAAETRGGPTAVGWVLLGETTLLRIKVTTIPASKILGRNDTGGMQSLFVNFRILYRTLKLGMHAEAVPANRTCSKLAFSRYYSLDYPSIRSVQQRLRQNRFMLVFSGYSQHQLVPDSPSLRCEQHGLRLRA